MEYKALDIPDVVLLTPKVFGDERGFFLETFRQSEFEKHCGNYTFVQDNHSKSAKGILRGLHYQLANPQGKLVRVTRGEVFDVAVDMRKHSPYYGQTVSSILTADNHEQMWIPPGFAHGFLVLTEEAEILYKTPDFYAPEHERTVLWNDPDLAIDWPLTAAPLLSDKDRQGQPFSQAEAYP